ALADGRLRGRADGSLWVEEAEGRFRNVLSGAVAPEPADSQRIIVNNRLRRALSVALAVVQLQASESAVRLRAAQQLRNARDADVLPRLREALAGEQNEQVRRALQVACANLELHSADAGERLQAVHRLAATGDAAFRGTLAALLEQQE